MARKSTAKSRASIRFYRNLLTARFFEGMVGAILELSGYEVYPYGYETLLPALRTRFSKRRPSPTEERLRSTPDLLVSDPEAQDGDANTKLVEVKFRNWDSPEDVKLSGISWYQRYWPDAILVLIIPGGDFFYAQAVSELDAHQKTFDLTTEFRPLSELFRKIHPEIATIFREDVMRFANGPSSDPPRRSGRSTSKKVDPRGRGKRYTR
ncbi:MAG: hypothetical protein ACE5JL_04600 [Dehalococcoidia bacterium]